MFNSKITIKMKNLIYAFAICLLLAGCEKYESGPINQNTVSKRLLTGSETILKNNLGQAAKILADVIQDEAVLNELTLLSEENRTFYSLPFKDLLDESKGAGSSFKNLREKFLEGCTASESKGSWGELASYLAKNGCYIYCPYPSSFYPKGTNSYTVAAHPIDNDIENTGYRFEGKKMLEVKVNEEYADKYQVILIMPKDEDNDDIKGLNITDTPGSKGDPVYEVKVGKVRCADYCGGIFEGELELRIGRGFPEYNMETGELKGKFSVVIPVDYPRSYAKAAINNWTVHSEGGWLTVNVIWDSNWQTTDILQGIVTYEYDQVTELGMSATVGFKLNNLSPSLTATAKSTYRGEILGINEWNRSWFYGTNTNPGPGDVMKDGWVVRTTNPVFKLTMPTRTI
jgi:hypothetical protein